MSDPLAAFLALIRRDLAYINHRKRRVRNRRAARLRYEFRYQYLRRRGYHRRCEALAFLASMREQRWGER